LQPLRRSTLRRSTTTRRAANPAQAATRRMLARARALLSPIRSLRRGSPTRRTRAAAAWLPRRPRARNGSAPSAVAAIQVPGRASGKPRAAPVVSEPTASDCLCAAPAAHVPCLAI
jgi:hypothetical protein